MRAPHGPHDLSLCIDAVHSVRVRVPGPDYWRGFMNDERAPEPGQRFRFSPPWRTVYASEVETPLVRVRLSLARSFACSHRAHALSLCMCMQLCFGERDLVASVYTLLRCGRDEEKK